MLLGQILGSGDALNDITRELPNHVHIESLGVDICDEIMSVAVAFNQTYSIIDGVLSVEGFRGELSLLLPTRAVQFSIQTSWKIGNLDFGIEVTKTYDEVIIEGQTKFSRGLSITEVNLSHVYS